MTPQDVVERLEVVQAVPTRPHWSGSPTAVCAAGLYPKLAQGRWAGVQVLQRPLACGRHLWLGKYQRDGVARLADHPTRRLLSQVTQAWLGVLFSASHGPAGSRRALCPYPR